MAKIILEKLLRMAEKITIFKIFRSNSSDKKQEIKK